MDVSLAFLLFTAITSYYLWFTFISRTLKGPRVWPLLGSLPGLIENAERMHEWIADNLRACGGTYQTCIFALNPFWLEIGSFVTVHVSPKNRLTRIVPEIPNWQNRFSMESPWSGIFRFLVEATWLFQRRETRHSRFYRELWGMAQVVQSHQAETAQLEGKIVDLQDLLLRLTFDNICGLTCWERITAFGWKGLPGGAAHSNFNTEAAPCRGSSSRNSCGS
ncbi:hypothetical protein Leryth_004790 [Lithospermum erythrorhizon]|nr:hypothetical protein Leryth_004790 [Lithospermum erythrorhizon]